MMVTGSFGILRRRGVGAAAGSGCRRSAGGSWCRRGRGSGPGFFLCLRVCVHVCTCVHVYMCVRAMYMRVYVSGLGAREQFVRTVAARVALPAEARNSK